MNKFEKFLEIKGITTEVYATKSADEMAGLYNEFNESVNKEIEGMIAEKVISG